MSGVSGIGGGAGGIQQIMQMRQQIIQQNNLLKNLHSTQGADATGAAGAANGVTDVQGPAPGFADTLKTALDSVNATQDKADNITAAYQKGEVTDVAKVMLARQEAGVAFEATLQVRNKLLSAYQDIMRMGV